MKQCGRYERDENARAGCCKIQYDVRLSMGFSVIAKNIRLGRKHGPKHRPLVRHQFGGLFEGMALSVGRCDRGENYQQRLAVHIGSMKNPGSH